MAFQREEMGKRNHFRAACAGRCGTGIAGEFGKCLLIHQHQVERKHLVIGRVELQEGWPFAEEPVPERENKFPPRLLIAPADNQVNVEGVSGVSVCDHRVPTGQEERKILPCSLSSEGGNGIHSGFL